MKKKHLTGAATFSVVGLPDCTTNIPLQIVGVNATLAAADEAEEESPGGFIPDRTVHTNATRTPLTLEACGLSSEDKWGRIWTETNGDKWTNGVVFGMDKWGRIWT